jgi:hypothetical protein
MRAGKTEKSSPSRQHMKMLREAGAIAAVALVTGQAQKVLISTVQHSRR